MIKPAPRLTLTIRHLGAIHNAALTLKNLTVIEGRHQSGTTRLATFAYALVRALGGVPRLPIGADVPDPDLDPGLRRFLETQPENGAAVDVPQNLHAVLTRSLERPASLETEVTGQLRHCFAVPELKELALQSAAPNAAKLTFEAAAADGPDRLWSIDGRLAEDALHLQGRLEDRLPQGFPKPPKTRHRQPAGILAEASRKGGGYAAARYLPASRATLLALYRVVAAQMVAGLARRETLPATLRGTDADFMQQLVLTSLKTPNRVPQAVCHMMETDVIHGRIAFHSQPATGYVDTTFTPQDGAARPLNQVSAAVAALAPLSLTAAYDLQAGDYLFVEEPETGLDPSAYPDLALGLTRLAHTGLNVLLTTHQPDLACCMRLALQKDPAQGLTADDAAFYALVRDRGQAINLYPQPTV